MRKRQSSSTAQADQRVSEAPPPIDGPVALDAWTRELYRRRFDERLARIDAAIDASRLSLTGAQLRRLPSAGLHVLAGVLLGAWLGKARA